MVSSYAQVESVSNLTVTQVHDEHPLGEATLRISGIELMKGLDVWRVEERPVRRRLLRRALGCTASDKEH
jgi:hypothetical protein